MRVHLFPFRTQKLSSPVPKILVWRRTGKIGQCQHKKKSSERMASFLSGKKVSGFRFPASGEDGDCVGDGVFDVPSNSFQGTPPSFFPHKVSLPQAPPAADSARPEGVYRIGINPSVALRRQLSCVQIRPAKSKISGLILPLQGSHETPQPARASQTALL